MDRKAFWSYKQGDKTRHSQQQDTAPSSLDKIRRRMTLHTRRPLETQTQTQKTPPDQWEDHTSQAHSPNLLNLPESRGDTPLYTTSQGTSFPEMSLRGGGYETDEEEILRIGQMTIDEEEAYRDLDEEEKAEIFEQTRKQLADKRQQEEIQAWGEWLNDENAQGKYVQWLRESRASQEHLNTVNELYKYAAQYECIEECNKERHKYEQRLVEDQITEYKCLLGTVSTKNEKWYKNKYKSINNILKENRTHVDVIELKILIRHLLIDQAISATHKDFKRLYKECKENIKQISKTSEKWYEGQITHIEKEYETYKKEASKAYKDEASTTGDNINTREVYKDNMINSVNKLKEILYNIKNEILVNQKKKMENPG